MTTHQRFISLGKGETRSGVCAKKYNPNTATGSNRPSVCIWSWKMNVKATLEGRSFEEKKETSVTMNEIQVREMRTPHRQEQGERTGGSDQPVLRGMTGVTRLEIGLQGEGKRVLLVGFGRWRTLSWREGNRRIKRLWENRKFFPYPCCNDVAYRWHYIFNMSPFSC